MKNALFPNRICKSCGESFAPRYANQWVHPRCNRPWRRRYWREYHRKQRRLERQSAPLKEES